MESWSVSAKEQAKNAYFLARFTYTHFGFYLPKMNRNRDSRGWGGFSGWIGI